MASTTSPAGIWISRSIAGFILGEGAAVPVDDVAIMPTRPDNRGDRHRVSSSRAASVTPAPERVADGEDRGTRFFAAALRLPFSLHSGRRDVAQRGLRCPGRPHLRGAASVLRESRRQDERARTAPTLSYRLSQPTCHSYRRSTRCRVAGITGLSRRSPVSTNPTARYSPSLRVATPHRAFRWCVDLRGSAAPRDRRARIPHSSRGLLPSGLPRATVSAVPQS